MDGLGFAGMRALSAEVKGMAAENAMAARQMLGVTARAAGEAARTLDEVEPNFGVATNLLAGTMPTLGASTQMVGTLRGLYI
jgi:hypothetical protein